MRRLLYVVGSICFMILFTACGAANIAPTDNIHISNNNKELEISLENSTETECEIIVKEVNSGHILQQFPCNISADKIELRGEKFTNFQTDLVVVYHHFEDEEPSAYLYQWDYYNECFCEEAAEIPYQYEILDSYTNIFTVTNEAETENEILIYKIAYGKVLEIRKCFFDKKNAYLSIVDSLTGRNLFEGSVALGEKGQILNEEYYQDILWQGVTSILDMDEEVGIKTTCTIEQMKADQAFVSREAMLEAYGFAETRPFYQYYDGLDRIQLELYLNEQTGVGCGVRYKYWYTPKKEAKVELIGFGFDSSSIEKWEKDVYSLSSVYGDAGETSVDDYKERIEYTKDDKIDYYVSQGIIDWLEEQPLRQNVLEIDFVYREDGTLFHRDYSHNSWIFGTEFCTLDSYYDEQQRLVYELGYITHGDIENYYIYTDEDEQPDYCLCLDWMGSECWPGFTCYQ